MNHLLRTAALITMGAGLARAHDAPIKSEPYTWRSVVIKANGFINGTVFSPVEKGLFYIHTDMGGAYRHDAATGEWVCLTDWIAHDDWSLNQMGVETMAVDPYEADRVYAAIGTYMGPSAIVRSTDRGATWQRSDVPFAMNGNGSARNAGERMNVDPNLPNRLIYGTRDKGLWQSDDFAASWQKIESFPATGDKTPPAADAGIVWTLFDKSSGQRGAATPIIYAGVCTTKHDKVFRSTDAGKTWSIIPNQPAGALLPMRAAIVPDGSRMYLTYIVGERYPGPHGAIGGGVYRVDQPSSSSPTWTKISPAEGKFGFSGVAIDPTDPNTVYVSTLNRYGDVKDDIYRSHDGGANWSPLQINTSRDDSSALYIKDFNMHWVGDVQVDPHDRNHALFTTGWGMYRTTDLRAAKPTWAFYNEGFEQSAVLELVSPPTGTAHLLSAIGDRDGYVHENLDESPRLGRLGQPNDDGQTESLAIGTNRDIDFAWNDPSVVARIGDYQSQYSLDGGKTWNWFEKLDPNRRRVGRPTQISIAVSADGKHIVRAERGAGLLRSQRIAPSPSTPASGRGEGEPPNNIQRPHGFGLWLPCDGTPQTDCLLAADLVAPSTFYAAAESGLFISTDGGASWTMQTSTLPSQPLWLRAIPNHQGHLWLTAGDEGRGGLHRSTDGGKTWTRIQPDLITCAKQLGFGAGAPGGDYAAIFIGGTVGSLRGFFRSDDQGKTWIRINDDAHQYGNVTVINGDTRVHGRLYVGTNGRGILYGDPAGK